MPEEHLHDVEEQIHRVRGIGTLGWIYHAYPHSTMFHSKGQRTLSLLTMRNTFLKMCACFTEKFCGSSFCSPGVACGDAITEMTSLILMGRNRNCHRQSGCIYYKGLQGHSSRQNVLAHTNLWRWIIVTMLQGIQQMDSLIG